ncbi:MAG: putative outer membrane protein, partial [Mucilaginibacter sp.]|nr:putative outer membrane protein [Mucilaginibacter sp.]
MKKILSIIMFATLLVTGSCKKDSNFLTIAPVSIVPTDVAFSDPALVLAVIGDLYNREVDFSGLDGGWTNSSPDGGLTTQSPGLPSGAAGWTSFTDFSESFPSDGGFYTAFVQNSSWNYLTWANWDYRYVRDLNLFLERIAVSTQLAATDKARFTAEARFLRAAQYFELAKRMGGVPIITKSAVYDFTSPISNLQTARAKESDVYDFVISELEAVKIILPKDPTEKGRATAAAALAMEARAAVYAGSIAKYGVTTPQVSLPGNEVGIPASMANGYYTKALAAAQQIINGSVGSYRLYTVLPNLADNYAAIFTDKSSVNQESIYAEDFKAFAGKVNGFTVNDQPYSNGEEIDDAGRLNPSLNLVQVFEKLDNTFAPIPSKDAIGNPIYYTDPLDAFAGRDARLAGTILLPGSLWKGAKNDIWGGYVLADGSIFTSDSPTNLKVLPGTTTAVQVVGKDGPIDGLQYHTQTGFYIRKWLDPTIGSGRRGRQSDVAFIRYRYAEVLLNAAEAAAELGNYLTASLYINQVRARAGLTTPLVLTSGNYFDRIVHERRVELCFEGLNLFDYKRWRIAHVVWDGVRETLADLTTNIGSATHRNTQPWGLWPYKIYNPASPNNGKWIFRETLP